MLKALAGSTWGCDKETLLTTYQAIGRSILSYCSPVWTPSFMDINWCRLQREQNYALRICTGCHKMADVAELHQEARELPVRQHSELISQQFTIACHLPQHPYHQLCHRPPDDRPERRRYNSKKQATCTSIQYNLQYNTIQHNTTQFKETSHMYKYTIQFTIQYNTIQHNTTQFQETSHMYKYTIQFTIQYNSKKQATSTSIRKPYNFFLSKMITYPLQ